MDTVLIWWMGKFQSTLPYGERRIINANGAQLEGFNPRSRMGSDRKWIEHIVNKCRVSIHAPVWGATIKAR